MKTQDYFIQQIRDERTRQDDKWGEQNHHPLLWFSIIGEEYGEMCKAFNEYSFQNDTNRLDEMQREAIQVAASCVAMLECIERMATSGMNPDGNRRADHFEWRGPAGEGAETGK